MSLKFSGQTIDLELKVWRDPGERLPTNFWWALGVSLLLHLFFLELGSVFDRPDGARELRGMALQVSLQAELASFELASDLANDSVETSETISGRLSSSVEAVEAPVFLETRKTPLTEEQGRRSRQGQDAPTAIQDIPVAAVDGSRYFRRSELTRPPVLLDEPMIDAPDDAENEVQPSGKVSLRLFVSASGELDRAEIERSAARSDFEDAAVAAFLPLHFSPAQIDGVAVNSQVVFEIDFDRQAHGSSRSSDQARWRATW